LKYKIKCGIEEEGTDLSKTTAKTFEECITDCAKKAKCIGIDYEGTTCHLKKTLSTKTPVKKGAQGAVLVRKTTTTA